MIVIPPPDHRGPTWVKGPRLPRWPGWAVALVMAWLGLGYLADALAKLTGLAGPTCLFKRVTTLPCPTCGSGRGGLHLLHGEPLAALALNPLLFAALGLGLVLLGIRLATGRRLELRLGPTGRRVLWATVVALVAANWIYLIVHGV